MEKHTCKLCTRSFANGRALGGHMRSHVASTAKAAAAAAAAAKVLSPSASLSSTSSSSHDDDDEEDEEEGIGIGIGYGLRENPRKSFRLVDPEFFPVEGGSSVVVQEDRESETESSRAPRPIHHRRGSKLSSRPATATPEPVSSVSDDATPEEDVAISLMMLSRDTWKKKNKLQQQEEHDEYSIEYEEEEEDDEDDGRLTKIKKRPSHHQQPSSSSVLVSKGNRSKYQCGNCKKVFRSYQALGGHRASHKKFKSCCLKPKPVIQIHDGESSEANASEKVRHQCPVCFRVFGSGQALGGHKRSHLTPSTTTNTTSTVLVPPPPLPPPPLPAPVRSSKFDLNLPAPMEEDAELSAVYDAEFLLHRTK